MRCQKKIAEAILKKEADYLLAVKGNQKKLYGELTRLLDQHWQENVADTPSTSFSEQGDKQHGRKEHRRCWVIQNTEQFPLADGGKRKPLLRSNWIAKKRAKVPL